MGAVDINTVKIVLHEIASHAYNLAMGLQNVAPPQTTTGTSVQYLKEVSVKLENTSRKIAELTHGTHKV